MTMSTKDSFWACIAAQMKPADSATIPARADSTNEPTHIAGGPQTVGSASETVLPVTGKKPALFSVGDMWVIAASHSYSQDLYYRITRITGTGELFWEKRIDKDGIWVAGSAPCQSHKDWQSWIAANSATRVEVSPPVAVPPSASVPAATGPINAPSVGTKTALSPQNITVNNQAYAQAIGWSQQYADSMTLASAKPNLGHDFTDRYCRVVSALSGQTVQLCKHCGNSEKCTRQCKPDPTWRAYEDKHERSLSDDRDAHRKKRRPKPPTYSAPELRASNMWACGLVKGTR